MVSLNSRNIDTFFFKKLNGLFSKNIIPCVRNEYNRTAESSRSNSLVGSFATSTHKKGPTQNRFTRLRQMRSLDHHVCIGAADNNNRRRNHSQVRFGTRKNWQG